MTGLRSPFSAAFRRRDALSLAAVMKVVAEPQRLRIIAALHAHGPMTGVALVAELGDLGQPTVTHHLNALTAAGLVRSRREGSAIWRTIDVDALSRLGGLLQRGGVR